MYTRSKAIGTTDPGMDENRIIAAVEVVCNKYFQNVKITGQRDINISLCPV